MAEMVQTKSVIHNKLMLFIAIVGLLMESEYEVWNRESIRKSYGSQKWQIWQLSQK